MNEEDFYKILRKFLDFLKGQTSFQNKDELKKKYENFNYKNGAELQLPDFGPFFDDLNRFRAVSIRGDKIEFIDQSPSPLGQVLGPDIPDQPSQRRVKNPADKRNTKHGNPPEWLYWNQPKYSVKLEHYPMDPRRIKPLTMNSGSRRDRELLGSALTWSDYTEKLQLLLHLEEFQLVKEMKRYNIPNAERKHATMKKDGCYLILEVPGLSENRPSVQPGDQLLVYPLGKTFQGTGFVVSVQREDIKLHFPKHFLDRFEEDMKFHVKFSISRLLLRSQHRAAELAVKHDLWELLFPDTRPASLQPPRLPNLRLFDERIRKNHEQLQAVQHIVARSSMPAPYLVFGPPGTGKTVTLVEAIKQIKKTRPNCHILACAKTNSATDLLCIKILEGEGEGDVYRMYALTLNPDNVPEVLKACSNLDRESFDCPTKKELMTYKIVVTTLCMARRLVGLGIGKKHFSHIFVDEAGQPAEPECLIPLAGLVEAGSGQVVLAGDPKQLGPIVKSNTAKKYGMSVSLLERLLILFCGNGSIDGAFDNRLVTKLLVNYRSHPDILKVPNDLFYGGQLKPFGNRKTYICCDWEGLPKMNFPVIFKEVTGSEEREARSPSFFNSAEVEILINYVQDLLQTKESDDSEKFKPEHIGIITPYRKQVKKIREQLEKCIKHDSVDDLKVGTVEEFQGEERSIILVSTVRSKTESLQHDERFHLGFVTNEKRFNVALTRAKALLIVVGSPNVLEKSHCWKTFIEFCKKNGGFIGSDGFQERRKE